MYVTIISANAYATRNEQNTTNTTYNYTDNILLGKVAPHGQQPDDEPAQGPE